MVLEEDYLISNLKSISWCMVQTLVYYTFLLAFHQNVLPQKTLSSKRKIKRLDILLKRMIIFKLSI